MMRRFAGKTLLHFASGAGCLGVVEGERTATKEMKGVAAADWQQAPLASLGRVCGQSATIDAAESEHGAAAVLEAAALSRWPATPPRARDYAAAD